MREWLTRNAKRKKPIERTTMNKAVEYEKRHGSIALLKACGSALNKLLVSKGIVTEPELIAALERGLDS